MFPLSSDWFSFPHITTTSQLTLALIAKLILLQFLIFNMVHSQNFLFYSFVLAAAAAAIAPVVALTLELESGSAFFIYGVIDDYFSSCIVEAISTTWQMLVTLAVPVARATEETSARLTPILLS
jgi:hypothetical protein